MDPFTALSLACGIIQVVDFSTKAVTKCRELYKDGSSSENEDFEEMANHLLSLRDKLDVPSHRNRNELQELGRKCYDTAEELIKELRKLKTKRPRKKREVASKAFKIIWKKETIDEIWKRLCYYRRILDTHILVDLRQRFDLLSVQQSKGFDSLDHNIQTMVAVLAAGPKQLDELAVVIRCENQSIKDHVTEELEQHRRNSARSNHIMEFLKSLWFEHINRRQETIAAAQEKTFEWIFETENTRKDARRWDNFVQWLESGQDTYWVNGKAGSGKSTLMSYIYQDDRTHTSLTAWSGTKALLTPSFFFWNAGSQLEKISEGLLRSLLYQVIAKYPDLTPPPEKAALKSLCAVSGLLTYEPIGAWTERRLQAILHTVMRQLQGSCRICIFIDGLDEFVGDQDALIATLKKLQGPEIKLCLSSRPDQPYSDSFGSSATLKLQDLTQADIEVFVLHKLQAPLQAAFAENYTEFLNTIVNKAEGVFLWVVLVVKDMLRGLLNHDSLDQLNERLQLMPSDIEGLYAHMLSNIDRIYQREAADLFHMALTHLTDSLLNVSLALFKAFDQVSNISVQDAIRFCELAEKRIPTTCAGLLEIHIYGEQAKDIPGTFWGGDNSYLSTPFRYEPSPELAKISRYERIYHVNFLHRTFVEFLQKSERGKRSMEEHSTSSWNPHDSFVRALLAKVSLLGFPTVVDFGHYHGNDALVVTIGRDFVYEVMEKVALAEQYTASARVSLCEDIDRTLTLVHQQRSGQSLNDHWSAHIGVDWTKAIMSCSEGLLMDLMPRSQTSSAQSYHPAMSEQIDHGPPAWVTTEPVDILGVACSHGLSHYAYHALDSRQDKYDQETVTHLLCCSMWTLRYDFGFWGASLNRMKGSLRLLCGLLKRGANPNFYVSKFSTTIWGEFLLGVAAETPIVRLSAYGKVPEVFVDHGANVHQLVYTEREHFVRGIASLQGRIVYDPSKTQIFRTRHERTALYIFQESLSGTPEFEALKNACSSRGALSLSRATHIALADENAYFRSYGMTDLQFGRFEAAVKKYQSTFRKAESMRLHLKEARQIARIWKEITNDADFDCQDDSDETTSDSAEDFHSCSSRISLSP